MKAVTPAAALVMLLLFMVSVVEISDIKLPDVLPSQAENTTQIPQNKTENTIPIPQNGAKKTTSVLQDVAEKTIAILQNGAKNSISIPPGGAYCADGDIKIYILNNGDTTLTASDIIVAQVDGVDVKGTPFFGDMKSGLVGYWKFDEASGATATDSSDQGNTGTLNGGVNRVAGKSKNALEFDGKNDYVNAGNAASLNTPNGITVEAWFKLSSCSNYASIARRDDVGGSRLWMLFSPGTTCHLLFEFINDAGQWPIKFARYSTPLGMSRWYHVAATYDPLLAPTNSLKIYLDGVLSATGNASGTMKTGTAPLTIGSDGALGDSGWFGGVIDEVKVSNKTVGDVNIKPGAKGLIVNYPGVEGRHTIRVATPANAAEATVSCL